MTHRLVVKVDVEACLATICPIDFEVGTLTYMDLSFSVWNFLSIPDSPSDRNNVAKQNLDQLEMHCDEGCGSHSPLLLCLLLVCQCCVSASLCLLRVHDMCVCLTSADLRFLVQEKLGECIQSLHSMTLVF